MDAMNETIKTLLGHRTIREFDGRAIPEKTMDQLFEVATHASTSRGFQHAAFIRVKDQSKKDALAEIGTQPYIARAPELLVAIVDARRSVKILEEMGKESSVAKSADVFREGFTDGILMVQNLTAAAESLGLGVMHLGSVLNDYERLIEVLELPQYTFPIVGMGLGYPGQDPQLKPRMPHKLRVMTDTYNEPDSWLETLSEYDADMRGYYDLRATNRRSDSYTEQVARKLTSRPSRDRFFYHVANQGFDVVINDEALTDE